MTSVQNLANRVPITIALMLATLMNTLDGTIANVALPHIQGSLSASQDQITWVLTSYIIAAAIMIPLSGWLSQKFGRKLVFLLSIAGFTFASMLCGIATTLPEIVAFRLLQGVAGATMMPLSQTIMLDLFPPKMIPQVMAVWSSVVILGPIMGPALGGWLTENASWRWVFYINFPIGVLAFIGLYVFMERDRGGQQRPFDYLGYITLVMFIGGLQFMLDRGPIQDWFDSTEIWTEGLIALIGLWIFIAHTATTRQPFFHPGLVRDRNFVVTTTFNFFVGMTMFSTSAMLPSMMQGLMGYSVIQSGYASMPRGIGSLIAFIFVPFLLRRIGARTTLLSGIIVLCVSLWKMRGFDLSMDSGPIVLTGFLQGIGTGLLFGPMTFLAYATLDPNLRAEGTTVSNMGRSLGASVGISVMQATLVRQSAAAHEALVRHLQFTDPVVKGAFAESPGQGDGLNLPAINAEITRQAAMIGYDRVFEILLLLSMVLLPLLVIVRSPRTGAAVKVEMTGE